jgi:hypothetical protein
VAFKRKVPSPAVSDQNTLVRPCLERVLQSSYFRASSRSKQFLRFVVEKKLDGHEGEIKERTIGIELFGRNADFETSGDSIVRVNATDVRRRLGQYYQEARDLEPVQIVLPPGTYVPEFVFQEITPPVVPSAGQAGPISLVLGRKNQQRRSRRFWWSCAVAGVIVVAALALILRPHTSNFDDFWQPVLDAHSAPVLSLPTTDTFQLELDAMQQFSRLKPGEFVQLGSNNLQSFHNWHTSLPVLKAALSVALALQRKGMTPILRIGTDLSSDELRGHPIIAIGSFSNPWTKQNVAGLRFTFDRSASDKEAPRIRDNRNPGRSWSLPSIYPKPQDKDYAIVTRTFDPSTRTPFVSLAGLHSFGNQIAGEFVSQESFWNELAGRAPAGWKKMNLQLVLETNVVGTTPSSPKIVEAYFWK